MFGDVAPGAMIGRIRLTENNDHGGARSIAVNGRSRLLASRRVVNTQPILVEIFVGVGFVQNNGGRIACLALRKLMGGLSTGQIRQRFVSAPAVPGQTFNSIPDFNK